MFIDDDSFFTDIVGNHFTRQGIACVYAATGSTALELLKHDPLPSAILLDVSMPDIDGFSVLKALKSDTRTHDIPVVMFSNDATPENKALALTLGAVDFLEKVQTTPNDVVTFIKKTVPSLIATEQGAAA